MYDFHNFALTPMQDDRQHHNSVFTGACNPESREADGDL